MPANPFQSLFRTFQNLGRARPQPSQQAADSPASPSSPGGSGVEAGPASTSGGAATATAGKVADGGGGSANAPRMEDEILTVSANPHSYEGISDPLLERLISLPKVTRGFLLDEPRRAC
jgi:hypothetical protein